MEYNQIKYKKQGGKLFKSEHNKNMFEKFIIQY